MNRPSWMIGNRVWEGMRLWHAMQGSVMQLHSADDQWTAHVNRPFPRLQKYDSLHRVCSGTPIRNSGPLFLPWTVSFAVSPPYVSTKD